MKLRKVVFSLILVIIFVTMLGGCNSTKKQDEELINGFVDKYASELKFNKKEWNKLEKDIEDASVTFPLVQEITIPLDNEDLQPEDTEKIAEVEYCKEYESYLTKKALNKMIARTLIPNFNMRETRVTEIIVKGINDTENENSYDVAILLKGKDMDETTCNINAVLEGEGEDRRIQSFDLDKINKTIISNTKKG